MTINRGARLGNTAGTTTTVNVGASDGTTARGETNGRAKLDADTVREILRLYAGGGWTYARLADRYGMGKTTVGQIIRREIWTHIEL